MAFMLFSSIWDLTFRNLNKFRWPWLRNMKTKWFKNSKEMNEFRKLWDLLISHDIICGGCGSSLSCARQRIYCKEHFAVVLTVVGHLPCVTHGKAFTVGFWGFTVCLGHMTKHGDSGSDAFPKNKCASCMY
jgi:hypothetical protein